MQTEAIIQSMTREERLAPGDNQQQQEACISLGSGTAVQDVNRLLKQFEQMKKMLKQMNALEKGKHKRRGMFPF